MKKNANIPKLVIAGFISLFFLACAEPEDEIKDIIDEQEDTTEVTDSVILVAGDWSNTFTEDFNNLSNWQKTSRFDYNSVHCRYDPAVPMVESDDSLTYLVLTATKDDSKWKSGHVKSNYSFKPNKNEEYHLSAAIKLVAYKDSAYTDFKNTYGAWPAFWTVEENGWPTKGEIDILEAYSYGGTMKAATNIFYGTEVGKNLLGTTCERPYTISEGWHVYDKYWKNVDGKITITISVDGEVKATYTNGSNPNLVLENFTAHNIILNLNVGDNYGIFDNSKIDIFTKTMMWVDYVKVEKRTYTEE